MFINFIFDLLYPKRCLSCGSLGSYLCKPCDIILYNIKTNNICPVCERPSIDGQTHLRCQTRYVINGFVSSWQYKGIVKKIIHKLKYDPFVSNAIDEIVEKAIKNINSLTFKKFIESKPILIPVPLHQSRFRYRGYNHSALVAKAFAKRWNLKVKEGFLIRIKKTRPQVELKGKQRIENVKNAFAVNHLTMRPFSHFLIVDDVWTTGSTLKTCASLLKRSGAHSKRSGAHSVWGITLAR